MQNLRITLDIRTALTPVEVEKLVEQITHPAIIVNRIEVTRVGAGAAIDDQTISKVNGLDYATTLTPGELLKTDNALRVIFPHKRNGVWIFSDDSPGVGLRDEPFVCGATEAIDRLVADIPGAENGFAMFFSERPFPQFGMKVDWVKEEDFGNWYRWAEGDHLLWLCPALLKYFDSAPMALYIKADALKVGQTSK